jgi:hypothetical protein
VDRAGPFVDLAEAGRAAVLRRDVCATAVLTALFRGVACRGFRAAFALFFALRAIRFCFATLHPPQGTINYRCISNQQFPDRSPLFVGPVADM